MPEYTFTIDKSDAAAYSVVLLTEDGEKAGTVKVVWPVDRDQANGQVTVGPYSVNADIRGGKLSYVLLWIGLTQVEEAGYGRMKTGAVHGVLHDTMQGAGLTMGEAVIDPTMRSKLVSKHLTDIEASQNSSAVWSTENIAGAKRACELKMAGSNVTVTRPVISEGKTPGSSGCCVIM